jgi:hypothetical protein
MSLADYISDKQPEYKISEESAKEQVRELISHYELDFSFEQDDKDGEKATERILDALTGFYREGLIENVKDDNLGLCVVQHTGKGMLIRYREVKGDDCAVVEKYGENEKYTRIWALMGRLCGQGEDIVKKLKGRDKQAMIGLAWLFLSV